MPRFYCPQPLAEGILVDLPEAVAHHLHVLRLREGDGVVLFNGEGGEYGASLASVDKRRASAIVGRFAPREAELPFRLTLAQALPEGAKMDWIVEKAVEMGVTEIQPLAAQRCVVRLSAERAEKRLAHWRGIVESASEQCGRNRLAAVAAPAALDAWLAGRDQAPLLLLSPRAETSLAAWARTGAARAATLLVGPEGGLTDAEEAAALRHGAQAVSIGPRVLRTETAGLAALATLAAAWEGLA